MSNNKIAGTYEVSPAAGYAGDVVPSVAWKILGENKDAVLIDVRTRAEWNYVGLPELASVDKKPALLEWQVFPDMQVNPEFVTTLGGAIADLAGLIGEVVSVERVPITFTVDGGKGRLAIGTIADAEITPYTGATGNPTILSETVFSTIPGSPVFASKADHFTRDGRPHGLPSVDLKSNNALQGHFRFAA